THNQSSPLQTIHWLYLSKMHLKMPKQVRIQKKTDCCQSSRIYSQISTRCTASACLSHASAQKAPLPMHRPPNSRQTAAQRCCIQLRQHPAKTRQLLPA